MTLRERIHELVPDDHLDATCVHTEEELRLYVKDGARIALEAALERRVLRHVQDSTGVVPVVELRALLAELEGK